MKKKRLIIAVIILILLTAAAVVGYLFYRKLNNKPIITQPDVEMDFNETVIDTTTKPSIYSGKDRPIAVMIDNHKSALPHAGLSKAYMVYEIIVEGGESRLMALFKGQNLDKIGPVRSSRHYFLDYALENDAIYVHYGWSPQAEYDIKHLGVNNINGLTDSPFWRVKDKSAPHNAVTSTSKLLEFANKKGYRTTSSSESVLKYSKEEVELPETTTIAKKVTIPFSTSNSVKWEYDEESKSYVRYTKGKKEVEWDGGETCKFKNIIVEFVKNSTLNDKENKGRQTLDNIGTKEGYYITNGKAIKITCSKASRASKTKYLDEDGKEIEVNDANTFVEICPIDAKVTFSEGE